MSTKIYYAYRFPAEKLNNFLDNARKEVFFNIAGFMSRQIALNPIKNFKPPDQIKDNPEKIEKYKRLKAFDEIVQKCFEASKSPYKDEFDIEAGFNIWLHEKYAYAMPIMHPQFIKFKFPKWIKNYQYWDNVDPDENVSEREWKKRGKIWDQVCCGTGTSSHNARRLYYGIIDFRDGQFMATFDLKEFMFKRVLNDLT